MSPLVDALQDVRALCRSRIAAGLGLTAAETADLEQIMADCFAESLRLETVEVSIRAGQIAERALALLDGREPSVDVAALEAAIATSKVVPFPSRRRAPWPV